jgi:hypothetical protein
VAHVHLDLVGDRDRAAAVGEHPDLVVVQTTAVRVGGVRPKQAVLTQSRDRPLGERPRPGVHGDVQPELACGLPVGDRRIHVGVVRAAQGDCQRDELILGTGTLSLKPREVRPVGVRVGRAPDRARVAVREHGARA